MYSPPLRHSKISKTEIFLVFDESKYHVITILAVACFVCFQLHFVQNFGKGGAEGRSNV